MAANDITPSDRGPSSGRGRNQLGRISDELDELTVGAAAVDWRRVAALADELARLAAKRLRDKEKT